MSIWCALHLVSNIHRYFGNRECVCPICPELFPRCIHSHFTHNWWYSILSKKQHNWFYKNLHNSGMVGRRKLPDPSLNSIFNALLIGVPIYALVSVNWFWLEVPSEVGKYLAEVLLLSRLNYCSVAYAQIPMYLTNSFMTEVPHI